MELSEDSKEAKKQVFDYCRSIKERKVISNNNNVEYQIVGKSYREILHHGISGIEDKDNPRIKYLSEEDKDYLLIATRVPEIIKNFKFLFKTKNEKVKHNVNYFEYYGCLVNCRGTDYFVRSTVAEYLDGKHYYDHIITKIEATEALSDNQSELLFYSFYKKDIRLSEKVQEEKELRDKILKGTAEQVRLMRKFEKINVIEFRNGKATHSYHGIEEMAYAFHCSPELIEDLIYNSQPFPFENDVVSFHLATN